MSDASPLRLFNSLTREIEEFNPIHGNKARVYSCGPTVYNYPHIGNMRAYVFADTLGRVLRYKGYDLKHVINITDVGHLTDDADAGEDKMEKMAAEKRQTAREIADHYTQAYWADFRALNCREPAAWSIATDYVPKMIEFAKGIADKHCYQLDSGLYFDTSTVPDYGRLARAATGEGESRIDPVDGKRHATDFAIWRKTPPGETRQMEWDSPWGRGAPGWHLECSVMSGDLLGFPFDIHTGGIDHREIHHPNEIAQNQAIRNTGGLDCAENSGARIWMHNNFLIDRTGKMSKSSGEFLRLQLLIDKGFHPLAYRLMCLQAHYRSELEFSWLGLLASRTTLFRWLKLLEDRVAYEKARPQGAPLDIYPSDTEKFAKFENELDFAISDDLNTPRVLAILNKFVFDVGLRAITLLSAFSKADEILGLGFFHPPKGENLLKLAYNDKLLKLTRKDLRSEPLSAVIAKPEIEARLTERDAARKTKDFVTSDRIRDELIAAGVEVMDGDPLGWDWRIDL